MDELSAPSEPPSSDEPAVVASTDGGRLRALGGYPGANAADVRFDGDELRLGQAFRDAGSEWTFYWHVGVEADAATALTVTLDDEVVGPWGPAVSHDRRTWSWLGADAAADHERFAYDLAAGERVFFAMAPAYVRRDFEAFWADVGDHSDATRERLATSPQGRPVPLVRLGDPGADEHVVVAARHHACETPGSYALEGLVRGVLAVDGALEGRCVHVAPIVDVDGVQRGDQGKSRVPHDHNRDYGAGNAILDDVDPIYPATAALQEHVRGLEGELALALDLHAPYKWGDRHDEAFFARAPADASPGGRRLAALLEAATDDAAGLDFAADPGFGEPGGFAAGTSFVSFCERAGAPVALTLEVPYVGTEGDRATPASCRGLGRALGRAALDWLEGDGGGRPDP